ncbi:palmitoyl-protein thioesterase 1 precursor [Ramicandelaber brevisporus]|nr:palmitoyl-protein thioesterase 1 precursor [Ramicandelaber brevisporus]
MLLLLSLLRAQMTLLAILAVVVASAVVVAASTPVVLWHGLGDSCCNERSMGSIAALIRSRHQANGSSTFVHSIRIGENEKADRDASFFGHTGDHIAQVCAELRTIPELANGFDAIGFSQGGLFMRAYIERCNDPPVRRLITFGSPHGGVSDLMGCGTADDTWTCRMLTALAKRAAYTTYIQKNLVPAQYYRDISQYDAYREYSGLLSDINNERNSTQTNTTYSANFSSLDRLVLVKFDNDTMVIPGESAHFAMADVSSEEVDGATPSEVKPMRQTLLYREDRIGLAKLDRAGKVHEVAWPGPHMRIHRDLFVKLLDEHL